MASQLKIFENETADGQYPSAGIAPNAKQGLLAVLGTFDGASVKLQMKAPGAGGVWADVRDTSGAVVVWTAEMVDTYIPFIPSNYLLRGDISGSGASTDLTMELNN